jgi:hypothetical protein
MMAVRIATPKVKPRIKRRRRDRTIKVSSISGGEEDGIEMSSTLMCWASSGAVPDFITILSFRFS